MALSVPQPAVPEHVSVQPTEGIGLPETVAVNCCVPLGFSDTLIGVMLIETVWETDEVQPLVIIERAPTSRTEMREIRKFECDVLRDPKLIYTAS